MDQTGALLALVTSGVAFGDAAANFVVLARGLPNPKPQIDTLHALVQGGLLFNTSHRLQAAFMLQAVEPAGAHAILCALAAKQSELPAVRELALQLLGGGTDSVAHMTPQQFIQHCATQSSQEQSSPSQPSAPVIVTAEQSATTLATSLSAAAQGPLLPARQQACLALLHQQVDGLPDGALGAAQFVSIAEHNPALAAEIIVALDRMPRHGSDAVAACIWALCDFRPSVSHLSCMAALVGRVDLPLPPLAAFISGTIAMVFSIRQDPPQQSRMAKLLAVYLGQLGGAQPQCLVEVNTEVEAFCVQFSRVKEVAAVYRQLTGLLGVS